MNKQTTLPLNLPLYAAAWVVIAVTTFYTGLSLPNDLQLPIHWNLQFEPDNFANKWLALLMLPSVSVFIALFMTFLPKFEPRKQNLLRSATAYQGVFWAVQVLFLIMQISIFSNAWQWGWSMERFVSLGMALLFLVMGNYLGKTRSTFVFGIRTPWTLSSETVWRKTHRTAGYGLVVVGALTLLVTPWSSTNTVIISLALMSVVLISSTIYSYFLWSNEAAKKKLKG